MIDYDASTITATFPDGTVADGEDTLVVTVRLVDTTGARVSNALVQVRVGDPTGITIDHDHPPGPAGFAFSYTDGSGEATATIRSQRVGEMLLTAVAAEDDGTIGGFIEPDVDFSVGVDLAQIDLGSPVGATTYSTPQTVTNTYFDDRVTITSGAAGITFQNCLFSPTSNDYSIVTNDTRTILDRCSVQGADVAGVYGHGLSARFTRFWRLGGHGVVLPDGSPSTSTSIGTCAFRRIGANGLPAYGIWGQPGRNVLVSGCSFAVPHSTAPQAEAGYTSSAAVRIQTDGVNTAGWTLWRSWIKGGDAAFVEVVQGTSGLDPTGVAVSSCRFGVLADWGASGATCADIDGDGVISVGCVDNSTGVLIDDCPGINTTPGLEFAPDAQPLDAQVTVTWTAPGDGGGGGGGSGGGSGGGIFTGEGRPAENYYFEVRPNVAKQEPAGGSVARAHRVGQRFDLAPVILGDDGNDDFEPYVIEWQITTLTLVEGSSAELVAELSRVAASDLSVPVTLVGGTAEPGDVSIPATLDIAEGSLQGAITVTGVDDSDLDDETTAIVLGTMTGTGSDGSTITIVTPGDDNTCAVTVLDDDSSPDPIVHWGLTALTVNEELSEPELRLPVVCSEPPADQVVVSVTFNTSLSTATVPDDVVWTDRTVAFDPGVGGVKYVIARLEDDALFEADETFILDLALVSGTASVDPAADRLTVTIESDDPAPPDDPVVNFRTSASQVHEGNARDVWIDASSTTHPGVLVNVQVVPENGAQPGTDYTINWHGAPSGQVSIPAADDDVSFGRLTITALDDGVAQPDDGESVLFRLQTGDGYDVGTTIVEHRVYIRDLDTATSAELHSKRLSRTSPSIVRATVAVPDVQGTRYDPADGWQVDGYTGQAYGVARDHTGEWDTVHVFGYVPGATLSEPGVTGAVTVSRGTGTAPITGPVDITTQKDTFTDLEVLLKAANEAQTFRGRLSDGTETEVIGPTSDRTWGADLFRRHRYFVRLLRDTATPPYDETADYCTVAVVYVDTRVDADVAIVHGLWCNSAISSAEDQLTASDVADGRIYFDYLRLVNIPVGYAVTGVGMGENSNIQGWDSGNGWFELIKEEPAGTEQHLSVPGTAYPFKVAVYNTSTVTIPQAREMLKDYDVGYAVGGDIGLDEHFVLSEVGFPGNNHGRLDFAPDNYTTSGWEGVRDYAAAWRTAARDTVVSEADSTFTPDGTPVRFGYFLPFAHSDNDRGGGPFVHHTCAWYPCGEWFELSVYWLAHILVRCRSFHYDITTGSHLRDRDILIAGETPYCLGRGKDVMEYVHPHLIAPGAVDDSGNPQSAAMILGPGTRAWNSPDAGHTCPYETTIDYQREGPNTSYPIFDWPHMSRTNVAVRDAWWLRIDPLAYEMSGMLGELGMLCHQRFPAKKDTLPDEMDSTLIRCNIPNVQDGLSAGLFPANHGYWFVTDRNGNSSDQSTLIKNPIERGWGWMLCAVSRWYAISDATTRAHMHGATDSWFDAVADLFNVIATSAGSLSSTDGGSANPNQYSENAFGPTDLVAQRGALPDEDAVEPEWYASTLLWHLAYVYYGIQALNLRVWGFGSSSRFPPGAVPGVGTFPLVAARQSLPRFSGSPDYMDMPWAQVNSLGTNGVADVPATQGDMLAGDTYWFFDNGESATNPKYAPVFIGLMWNYWRTTGGGVGSLGSILIPPYVKRVAAGIRHMTGSGTLDDQAFMDALLAAWNDDSGRVSTQHGVEEYAWLLGWWHIMTGL